MLWQFGTKVHLNNGRCIHCLKSFVEIIKFKIFVCFQDRQNLSEVMQPSVGTDPPSVRHSPEDSQTQLQSTFYDVIHELYRIIKMQIAELQFIYYFIARNKKRKECLVWNFRFLA